ncbi:MAG: sulfur oxidation c-type cytochrome SoxA [Nitrospinae bacterium]|nr:sulfur oxidation c-type cytochrome SoxA [Nitrospinota bacterium]
MNVKTIIAALLAALPLAVPAWAEETQSISDADLALYREGINPAEVLRNTGGELFNKKMGPENLSCADCHEGQKPKAKALTGAAAAYPKHNKNADRVMSLQLQINNCVEKGIKAEPYKLNSAEITALTLYVKGLSNGMKVNVATNGPAQPWYEVGKQVYEQRRGQRNLSCKTCHDELAGHTLRMQKLASIGAGASHWPAYRMVNGDTFLIEQRFKQCMSNARMAPLKEGSDPMVALELYVTSLANGAAIETPGFVR